MPFYLQGESLLSKCLPVVWQVAELSSANPLIYPLNEGGAWKIISVLHGALFAVCFRQLFLCKKKAGRAQFRKDKKCCFASLPGGYFEVAAFIMEPLMILPKRWLITIVLSPHGSVSVGLDKSVPHSQFRGQASSLLM